MNSSGIVRKVDELGRIVIPVEIRKSLNIKEGDNLEFNINDNGIFLSKKSLIKQNISILSDIEKSLSFIVDGEYIITDREKVLFSSNKSLIDCSLKDNVINLLNSQEEYHVVKDLVDNKCAYVFPYFHENVNAGFIIIYDINDVSKYVKLVKFIVSYINDSLSIS